MPNEARLDETFELVAVQRLEEVLADAVEAALAAPFLGERLVQSLAHVLGELEARGVVGREVDAGDPAHAGFGLGDELREDVRVLPEFELGERRRARVAGEVRGELSKAERGVQEGGEAREREKAAERVRQARLRGRERDRVRRRSQDLLLRPLLLLLLATGLQLELARGSGWDRGRDGGGGQVREARRRQFFERGRSGRPLARRPDALGRARIRDRPRSQLGRRTFGG